MATSVLTSYFPITDGGEILVGARVFVLNVGTTTLKAIYSDQALSAAIDNPMDTDADGFHPQAYLSGAYKIRIERDGTDTLGSGTLVRQWDNIDGGVPVGSGDLPVVDGGTGASTPAAARTNLEVPSQAEVDNLSAELAELAGAVGSTGATQLATGNTAQRPADLSDGQVRRNTTTANFEGYNGSGWENFITDSEVASQAQMEADSSAAAYVAPSNIKYSPRVAKAWAYVTYSAGVPTLAASVNVSGIVDNGPGDLSLTYTTALSAAGGVAGTALNAGSSIIVTAAASTTTGCQVRMRTDGGSLTDPTAVTITVHGVLP
jgi:hypothetical protein